MQVLENEFENLVTDVIKKRHELIYAGLINCGCDEEWMKDPDNRKRCMFEEAEDTVNGGFRTVFFLDDVARFEVKCVVNHKTVTVDSELKMFKEE